MSTTRMFPILFLRLLLLLILSPERVHAQISCTSDKDCQTLIKVPGLSKCKKGICTNPFSQGCLKIMEEYKLSLQEQQDLDETTTTNANTNTNSNSRENGPRRTRRTTTTMTKTRSSSEQRQHKQEIRKVQAEDQVEEDDVDEVTVDDENRTATIDSSSSWNSTTETSSNASSSNATTDTASSTTSTPTIRFQDTVRVCNSDDVYFDDFSNCYLYDQHNHPNNERAGGGGGVTSGRGGGGKGDDESGSDSTKGIKTSLYDEIRIGSGDWESSIFLSWIIQILLSELLHVPVTIETSTPMADGTLSFYSPTNDMVYPSIPYNYESLQNAKSLNGDCTKASRKFGNDTCSHVLPEVWSGQINAYKQALANKYIEPPEGNGMVGKFSFMIPKILAQQDPSLTSYHGLKNRTKMAELFKRPMTYLQYCTSVSSSNCTSIRDTTATKYPTIDEGSSYFLPPYYYGYFEATDDNDCVLNPETCTGHVVDPPCDWDTLTESQMYWNNIPLRSNGPLLPNNGYSYFQMIEIWNAANYTKSPIFLWWWKPDSLDQLYFDTDYALQPTFLPPPTEECEKNRVTNVDRCSANFEDRIGTSSIGSCDFPAHSLQKVISTSLLQMSLSKKEALRSPAYEFIKRFSVTDLSVTIMLREWIHMKVDTYGIDPRIAVCEWVYDNIDDLEAKFIPPGYPRIFEEEISKVLFIVSETVGFIALCVAIVSTVGTLKFSQNLIFRYAHVPFVLWILAGLVLVCCGSILVANPRPSKGLCIAQPFLVSLGYTIELMPLVVKVSAINHLIHESKRMRKVHLNTKRLHIQVITVTVLVFIYLVIWSALDPPHDIQTSTLVQSGEAEVSVSTTCASTSNTWVTVAYAWQGFLLLSALVLAVQSRNVKQEFNESQSLAFMVYSHTLFLILRAIIYMLPPDNFTKSNMQSSFISLCLSLDSLNTLMVYFGPKFYAIANKQDTTNSSRMSRASSVGGNRESLRSGMGLMAASNASLHGGGGGGGAGGALRSDLYDEPPPKSEEMKSLLLYARALLDEAALTRDVKEDEPKFKRNDEETNHVIEDFTEETHYMTRDDLSKLRDICTRIGKARFEWDEDLTYRGGSSRAVGVLRSTTKSSGGGGNDSPSMASLPPNTSLISAYSTGGGSSLNFGSPVSKKRPLKPEDDAKCSTIVSASSGGCDTDNVDQPATQSTVLLPDTSSFVTQGGGATGSTESLTNDHVVIAGDGEGEPVPGGVENVSK